jgi:hypothetical protein
MKMTGSNVNHRILVLWVTARSRSTAFERMMLERGDLHVIHEPFGRYYYFSEKRHSNRAHNVKPKPQYDFESISRSVLMQAKTQPLFIKDQAYYSAPQADHAFLSHFENTFLIRHPKDMLPSLFAKMPDFTTEETGYEALHHYFELAKSLALRTPIVIDSDDLVTHPIATVQAYCEAVDIPFVPQALEWERGLPSQFVWWDGGSWLDDMAVSSTIAPIAKEYISVLDNETLCRAYERCLPYYQELYRHRLDISRYLSQVAVLETPNKGKGVFAQKNFRPGDLVVMGMPVATSPERTWQTLQVDIDLHVRMDEPFELVNHSCDPNCGIKRNRYDGYDLVAMKTISRGEEITFDYCMTEWISIAVPHCNCQSSVCRDSIKGGKFLSDRLLEKYQGFLAPYYEKLLIGNRRASGQTT